MPRESAKPSRKLLWRNRGTVRCLSIRLSDYRTPVNSLTGYDAFSGSIVLVDERYVSDRRLELLNARVHGGVVFHVRHHKSPAALLGTRVLENRLHLLEGICRHSVRLQP